MAVYLGFCSRCGGDVAENDRACGCCGAETVDANVISLLKRISARRSRRGRDEDASDDVIPL